MKKCSKCKELINLVDFYKDKHSGDGLQNMCKACTSIRNKEYRLKYKEYFISKGKARYKLNCTDIEYNKKRYMKNREKNIKYIAEKRRTLHGNMYSLMSSARTRAREQNLEFDVNVEFLIDMYEQLDGKCAVTGIPFRVRPTDYKLRYFPFSPSIDKIDPFKGYTKDNVRIVLLIVNLSLNQFGDDVFDFMCREYVKNSKDLKEFNIEEFGFDMDTIKPSHGMTKSETHRAWLKMKDKASRYDITVCGRWCNFKNFLKDMGERPAKHSINLYNPALGYTKDNCFWDTKSFQAYKYYRQMTD